MQEISDALEAGRYHPFHAPCGILLDEADRLLVDTEVVRLGTDPGGRVVTEVVAEQRGERLVVSADIVALAAGAANSARILLRSASDLHPRGLANGSDQVGRNYMYHNSRAAEVRRHGDEGRGTKLTALAPRWSLADVARHAVDFWLTTASSGTC